MNLHHLGDQIERRLSEQATRTPQLRFSARPILLGTAGALRNAAGFLSGGGADFSSSTPMPPSSRGTATSRRHRESRRAAPCWWLKTDTRAVHAASVRRGSHHGLRPTGTADLSSTRAWCARPPPSGRIPPGETWLVADLWERRLPNGARKSDGYCTRAVRRPRPPERIPPRFARSALARRAVPPRLRHFRRSRRLFARREPAGFAASESVIGERRSVRGPLEGGPSGAGRGRRGERLSECLVAGGRVPDGARYQEALLLSLAGGGSGRRPRSPVRSECHGVHTLSPRR